MSVLLQYSVLLVLVVLKISRNVGACGTLSTDTPEVVEGHALQVEFVPSSTSIKPKQLLLGSSNVPLVVLFDRSLNDREQRAKETKQQSKYLYTITSISKAQAGRCFVLCDNNNLSNELKIRVISTAYCGTLTVVKQNNDSGSTIQLKFDVTNKQISNIEWFHYNNGKYELLDKHNRKKYEEAHNGQVFVLKIYQSTTNDAGLYKAHCGNQQYSNEVRVNVGRPSNPVISDSIVKEGIESQIICSSHGGRPKPNIKFIFNNAFENYTNIDTFDTDNRTYSVESTFRRNLSRWDNGKPIECCVEHDTIKGRLVREEISLNVNFPPLTVQLQEFSRSKRSNGLTKLSLICYSGESNPVPNITWTGMKNIQRKDLDLTETVGNFRGYSVKQVVYIIVGRLNFGKEISCGITNTAFPDLTLNARVTVNITYPPYVTLKEGPELKVRVGQNVRLTCLVDSNPASNVSWRSTDDRNLTQDSLNEEEHILYFHSAQTADSGTYICSAVNERGEDKKNITLVVNDSLVVEKDTLLTDPSNATGIVAGVIGAFVAVSILIIIVVVFLRIRKKNEMSAPKDVVQHNFEDRNRLDNQEEDHVYNNTAEVRDEPAEYAVVLPKAQRQNEVNNVKNGKVTANDLVYAELDLESPDTARVVRRSETEQIEYVELDFKNKPPPSQNDDN